MRYINWVCESTVCFNKHLHCRGGGDILPQFNLLNFLSRFRTCNLRYLLNWNSGEIQLHTSCTNAKETRRRWNLGNHQGVIFLFLTKWVFPHGCSTKSLDIQCKKNFLDLKFFFFYRWLNDVTKWMTKH